MATIKDVAREAGVSIATVSRVFNNKAVVSEETQRQVRKVAARLKYWPHAVARSLITNRTHAVGLLLPDLYGEFFSEVMRGVDLVARKEDLHLLVSVSHARTEELIAALRTMRGRIDGLIVMAPDVDFPAAIRGSAVGFPLVLIDPGVGVKGFDSISIGNHEGAYAIVQHLLSLGHRRIATVTGPQRNVDAQQRLAGYREALRDSGVGFSSELVIGGDFTEPSGYSAVSQLLGLKPWPTAVFAANDYMAVGVLGALSKAGVAVPQTMSVAGFDDIRLARYLNPPLTTVKVDAFHVGERAARLLLSIQQESDSNSRQHEILATSLVVRGSSGPPPTPPMKVQGRRSKGRHPS